MFKNKRGESKVLDAMRAILPDIEAAAEETERNRGLDGDLLVRMQAAGLFRMMIPKARGGEEMTPLQVLRVVEELSRADASAGWTAMVANGFNAILGLFPVEAIDEMLANGPDLRMRGALAPKGRLVEVDGGYLISGQWPFGSGSYQYDWVVGSGLVFDGPAPRMVDGQPVIMLAAVRPDEAKFLDTWNSVGMRGSSSHDFVLDDVFVPAHRVANMMGQSNLTSPVHRLPFPVITTGQHTAISTGCAMAALADLGKLARTKRPAFKPDQKLVDDPVFANRFGELVARLDGLRSYADAIMDDTWELACSDYPITPGDGARARSMCAKVSLDCVDLVNEAMTLAGSTIVYSDHPMQRRWRDVRVAAQHAAASTDSYSALAAAYFVEELQD
jgi:alkylation response protein AidB-like acyl-CoA dehydrogenase